ncbi:MAG: hypothetical protein FJ011_11480 [Chloroflexi bacterium]|nr:hypothetical protein [Chloroflexota bacterium]
MTVDAQADGAADGPAVSPPSAAATDLLRAALPDALARDDFGNLAVLLRHARAGCWAFALYNYVTAREQVAAALKQLLAPLPVFEWTYAPHDPHPIAYLNQLSEAEKSQRAIVFLFDFERANADVWKALDYNRELFSAHPHGLVFWFTPPGRARVARQAPHFWAQRSGVFDFAVTVPPTYEQARPLVGPQISLGDKEEIQRQLRLYLGMLDDLAGQDDAPPLFVAELHDKIARLAYYLDELPLSRTHAEISLQLAREQQDMGLEANVRKALGDLALREADLAAARRHYEAALAIYPGIGARLGEANVLQALGDLALREADLAAARRHYEAALAIYPGIGDRLGEANVRKALGILAIKEGHGDEALRLLNAALTSYREIGERLGEAGTYMVLGRATDDAAYFERALALHAQIQSAYDVAVDSYYYGLSQKKRGDKQKAAALLIQARDIWTQIGLPMYAQIAQDELNGLGA